MIRIHNSLTGEKQDLTPIEPGHVRMYSCGVTVYDYFHVGNARMLVVFDMVSRYLRHRGLRVTYVRNITDVDDKIINRAREKGIDWRAFAKQFTDAMHEDLDQLGCLRPEKEPKASEYIDEMLKMIGQLVERGYAYQATDGDVMYDVHKFGPYGQLSGKKLEDLRAGARKEVNLAKRDPLDFVLWKSAKPGEPAWPSPWGEGRPGWHIECSAMATKELGEHFDLHGGGLDLKFPHHENEIAQSCGATGAAFVNIWMHNGFLNVERKLDETEHLVGERNTVDEKPLPGPAPEVTDHRKMSKSQGNFFTTRAVLKEIKHPEVLRFFLLSSHYRGPMLYSPDQLTQAEAGLNRLYTALRGVPAVGGELHSPTRATVEFEAAMDDDFNTPKAIAVLQGLAGELNTARADPAATHRATLLAGELRALGHVLGFVKLDPETWFRAGASDAVAGLSDADIQALIAGREAARKAKQWAESDRMRDVLAAAGVILEDKPGGVTTWRRA